MTMLFLSHLLLLGVVWSASSVSAATVTVSTFAGVGSPGYSGDGGYASNAVLQNPFGVKGDSLGNVYIADTYNHVIRKVSSAGIITTFIGSSQGDAVGTPLATLLNTPVGIYIDSGNNIYIGDYGCNKVKKYTAVTGIVTLIAGTGAIGYAGDGGDAVYAAMFGCRGVATDTLGNLYIADSENHRIRRVDSANIITTVAGNGDAGAYGDGGYAVNAALSFPFSVAVDSHNNFYLTDTYNNVIRKVDVITGIISNVAGSYVAGFADSIVATSGMLYGPRDIVFDKYGDYYIADFDNNRIRKVDAYGSLTTLAGDGSVGEVNGPATSATFTYPIGVGMDNWGNVYSGKYNSVNTIV